MVASWESIFNDTNLSRNPPPNVLKDVYNAKSIDKTTRRRIRRLSIGNNSATECYFCKLQKYYILKRALIFRTLIQKFGKTGLIDTQAWLIWSSRTICTKSIIVSAPSNKSPIKSSNQQHRSTEITKISPILNSASSRIEWKWSRPTIWALTIMSTYFIV